MPDVQLAAFYCLRLELKTWFTVIRMLCKRVAKVARRAWYQPCRANHVLCLPFVDRSMAENLHLIQHKQ